MHRECDQLVLKEATISTEMGKRTNTISTCVDQEIQRKIDGGPFFGNVIL